MRSSPGLRGGSRLQSHSPPWNITDDDRRRQTPESKTIQAPILCVDGPVKITDRSFHCASPCLWNQLPLSLRQPHSGTSFTISDSPIPSLITSSSFVSLST